MNSGVDDAAPRRQPATTIPAGPYQWRQDMEWEMLERRDMEFRLTYAGPLLAHNESQRGPGKTKTRHKHDLRQHFHRQIKALWQTHPALITFAQYRKTNPDTEYFKPFNREGFLWQPLVRGDSLHSMICRLDILMLRHGGKGGALADIDNRLKTLSDALQMPSGSYELPYVAGSTSEIVGPAEDENPFYVLLENDRLLSAVSVETDSMFEPVPDPAKAGAFVPEANAVRLVITATVRPYSVSMDMTALL